MMYGLDHDGKPAEGAPEKKYLSPQYPKVCWVCFAMGAVVRDSIYWRARSDADKARYDRLKDDGKYFG